MNQRSPVPEWFGRGEPDHPDRPRHAAPAPGTPSRGAFGCVALVLALGLGIGGVGFGLAQQARARTAETRLTQKRVELERTQRQLAAERAGAREQPPPVPTPLAAPAATPAPDADASAEADPAADASDELSVITALSPKLRTCFDNALAYAPDSHGRLEVTVLVSETGSVDDVTVVASGNLPGPVTSCVKAVTRTARFGPASEQRSVRFPLVFQN